VSRQEDVCLVNKCDSYVVVRLITGKSFVARVWFSLSRTVSSFSDFAVRKGTTNFFAPAPNLVYPNPPVVRNNPL